MRRSESRNLIRIGAIVLCLAGAAFILSVNSFPSINNDGVEYIAHSRRLADLGLVQLGYRQVGYPLFLFFARSISGLLGVEALLFAVLIQRFLLVVALAYSIWVWRWKSLPLAFLVVTPSVVAYSDLVMTEALSVPLALLIAAMISHHFTATEAPTTVPLTADQPAPRLSRETIATMTLWGSTALAFALVAIRYPFVVFGAIPVVLFLDARRRRGPTRPYVGALTVYTIGVILLTIGFASENNDDLGVFSPTARNERSMYWSAWHLVFTLHPENRAIPELTDFYDDGSPYPRIWEIEDMMPEYHDQADRLRASVTDLLTAADLSLTRERAFSLLGALRGGRLDELRPRLENILATDASKVDGAIHVNDVSRREGQGVFNDRYNGGSRPQAVITSPAFPSPPLPYVTTALGFVLPVSLLGTLVLAVRKREILLGSAFLVPTIIYAIALAWFLADNARFLMTTSLYSVAGLCALWSSPVRAPRRLYRLEQLEHEQI
ncbi:MAG TPA: hypothetical protein VIC07_06045 [Acidimicrobiia bacterium]